MILVTGPTRSFLNSQKRTSNKRPIHLATDALSRCPVSPSHGLLARLGPFRWPNCPLRTLRRRSISRSSDHPSNPPTSRPPRLPLAMAGISASPAASLPFTEVAPSLNWVCRNIPCRNPCLPTRWNAVTLHLTMDCGVSSPRVERH